MKGKFIYCMGLLVFIVLVISACGYNSGKDEGTNTGTPELQADITDLPDSLSRDDIRIINSYWQQQYRYQSSDGEKRLVLEIRIQPSDTEDATEADTSIFYEPESGEAVFQWTKNNLKYKLFGTFSEDELKKISESVQVNTYE